MIIIGETLINWLIKTPLTSALNTGLFNLPSQTLNTSRTLACL